MLLLIWILLKVVCILHLLWIEEGLIREDALKFMAEVTRKEIPKDLKERLEKGDYIVPPILII